MRKLALSTSAATILIAAAAGSAVAQDATGTPPAQLTCSDISTLEAAHAAALVYYVAGYIDAQGAAAGGAMAAGGGEAAPADQAAAPAEGEAAPADQASDQASGAAPMVGGLTLSAKAVIDACASSPDMLISDVIAQQGGSGAVGSASAGTAAPGGGAATEGAATAAPAGQPADSGATAPADGAAPADQGAAPAEGEAAPAN